MSVCTSIVKVETVQGIGDLLLVSFDDRGDAYWWFSYADSLQYVSQPVIVETHKDIFRGEMHDFIRTFTTTTVIQTLDKSSNIKLYCDQVDNFANLSFNEIADGENRKGCIVFCTHQEFKSSNNAVWMELIIRDRLMHTAKLRIFDYETKEAEFAGKYIATELSRNKYGFQSTVAKVVNGECPPNPEITIAREFITNFFAGDEVATQFINRINLFSFLEEHVDYEMGYSTMRLAMELAVVDSMENISKDVDLVAISHAILASYAYITRTSVLSPEMNNVFLATQFSWPNKTMVMRILDDLSDDHPAEYKVFKSIKSMISTLLEVRKGVVF